MDLHSLVVSACVAAVRASAVAQRCRGQRAAALLVEQKADRLKGADTTADMKTLADVLMQHCIATTIAQQVGANGQGVCVLDVSAPNPAARRIGRQNLRRGGARAACWIAGRPGRFQGGGHGVGGDIA